MSVPTITINPDALEDEDGNALDFGSESWEDGAWSGGVRAKASASAGEVTLTATYGGVTTTETIEVVDGLEANIVMPSGTIHSGVAFNVSATVTGEDGLELTRLPDGTVSLDVYLDDSLVASEDNVEDINSVYLNNVTLNSAGELKIQVIDNRDDSVLDEVTQNVQFLPSLENLAEAINERNTASRRSSSYTSHTAAEGASTLREAAWECIKGRYLKSFEVSGGNSTYAYYTQAEAQTLIPPVPSAAEELEDWIETAYTNLCTVTKDRIGGGNITLYHNSSNENFITEQKKYVSESETAVYYKDISGETESALAANAASAAENKYSAAMAAAEWSEYNTGSDYGYYIGCTASYSYAGKAIQACKERLVLNVSSRAYVGYKLSVWALPQNGTPYDVPNGRTYNDFGTGLVQGTYFLAFTVIMPMGSEQKEEYYPENEITLTPHWGDGYANWGSGSLYFAVGDCVGTIEYLFKHR